MLVTGIVGEALFPSIVSENLLAFGAGVVGAFLVLLVAFFIYQWIFAPPGRQFARLIGSLDSVAVLMHPNPDPDAMSCALAADAIAESAGTETTLYYSGEIRHHENRAFETVLDVDFDKIESVDEIAEKEVILVDHNEPRGFDGCEEIDPIAVIDHHPGSGTGAEFSDIRVENGACATIFAEYFQQLRRPAMNPSEAEDVDDDEIIPPRIATGLLYGIQSDTNHLTNGCTPDEFAAASVLYPGIEEDKLDRIANPDMDVESLDVKARAIVDRDVRGVFAISDVGEVSNVDSIPQAADELRRLEGVNAVVVLGHKDETIKLSGRSTDDRVHMGKVIETAIEAVPMADGGGHARMGGGQIPVDHMEGLGPADGMTREELKERLFNAMNGEL